MKHTPFLLAGMLCTYACIAQNRQLKDADIIIRHANVITMEDSTPLPNRLVCIKNNHISYIGHDKGDTYTTSAKIVDATGKYLMPGLGEMHVHLPSDRNELKQMLTLNLMAGVTTVRSMRGKQEHVAFRNAKQDYPTPHLYLGSPIITHLMNLTPWRADSLVGAYKEAGFDFIKVIAVKDTASFDNLMDAASRYGLSVCGHVPGNIGIAHAIEKGFNCVEHMDGYLPALKKGGPQYLEEMIRLTKNNNVYQDPTLDWYMVIFSQMPEEELKLRSGLNYMPDSVREDWHKDIAEGRKRMGDSAYNASVARYAAVHADKLAIMKKMHDAGVIMLTGSEGGDTYMVPGFNMIEEMKQMKRIGLTNYETLQCATVNVAKYMGTIKREGTVTKGKEANLIIVASNPLESIQALDNVETVLLDNNVYTRSQLESYLP
jgi:imidazolonepropionase-like amidohydrolase